jgi:hypothetical protein
MKDASRRLNRLRRKVYRKTPIAIGSLSESTAWRCGGPSQKRFSCLVLRIRFLGQPEHTVTIVEADGVLRIHDAFFNLSYPVGLCEVLDALRGGIPIAPKTELRDRKIYVIDPGFEAERALRWFERMPIENSRRSAACAVSKSFGTFEAFTTVAPASRQRTANSRSEAIPAICAS